MKIIVKGTASGEILKSEEPINFLGSVDKKTGEIKSKNHPLFGKRLAKKILVFPHGIGSSVGAYTIFSINSNNVGPVAMICKKSDITVISGCALANIPMVLLDNDEFSRLKTGQSVLLNAEIGKISENLS